MDCLACNFDDLWQQSSILQNHFTTKVFVGLVARDARFLSQARQRQYFFLL